MSAPDVSARAWPTVSLGEVAEMCLGKMLDAKKNKGKLQPYLRNPNVRWFDVDLDDVQMMPFEEHEEDRYGLSAGDVVICEGGEAGRAAIWDGRVLGMKFQKAIHRVRCGPRLDARFLVHQLMFDYANGRLSDYYTGATIKHLTGQDLARYRFALPPLTEQRRIVEILDKADALLAKRREAIAKLDGLAQAIFVEMFGDPVTNPMGWPRVSLAEVGEFIRGITFSPDDLQSPEDPDGVACMRTKNVQAELDLSDTWWVNEGLVRRCDQILQAGDILVSSANSWSLVGKCCLIPELPMRATFGGFVSVLRADRSKLLPKVLFTWFRSGRVQAVVRSFGQQTTNISNLNVHRTLAMQLPLPPYHLQEQFSTAVQKQEEIMGGAIASSQELNQLFACLQDRAFQGEL